MCFTDKSVFPQVTLEKVLFNIFSGGWKEMEPVMIKLHDVASPSRKKLRLCLAIYG